MVPYQGVDGRKRSGGKNGVDWVDGFWFGGGRIIEYDKGDYHTQIYWKIWALTGTAYNGWKKTIAFQFSGCRLTIPETWTVAPRVSKSSGSRSVRMMTMYSVTS